MYLLASKATSSVQFLHELSIGMEGPGTLKILEF